MTQRTPHRSGQTKKGINRAGYTSLIRDVLNESPRGKDLDMLILTRNTNETIVIDENIRITIIDVKGAQVRLGIEAPKHVAVHREEIYERIKAGVPLVPKAAQR